VLQTGVCEILRDTATHDIAVCVAVCVAVTATNDVARAVEMVACQLSHTMLQCVLHDVAVCVAVCVAVTATHDVPIVALQDIVTFKVDFPVCNTLQHTLQHIMLPGQQKWQHANRRAPRYGECQSGISSLQHSATHSTTHTQTHHVARAAEMAACQSSRSEALCVSK